MPGIKCYISGKEFGFKELNPMGEMILSPACDECIGEIRKRCDQQEVYLKDFPDDFEIETIIINREKS